MERNRRRDSKIIQVAIVAIALFSVHAAYSWLLHILYASKDQAQQVYESFASYYLGAMSLLSVFLSVVLISWIFVLVQDKRHVEKVSARRREGRPGNRMAPELFAGAILNVYILVFVVLALSHGSFEPLRNVTFSELCLGLGGAMILGGSIYGAGTWIIKKQRDPGSVVPPR